MDCRWASIQLALQRLDEAAEKAKKLSATTETEINIPFITSDASAKASLVKLTRAQLEDISAAFIDKSVKFKQVLKDSGFSASDIDQVILVGGQTRMPKIADAVKAIFNKEPNRTINPSSGAQCHSSAGVLKGDVRDVLLLDVTPLSHMHQVSNSW